MQNGAGPDEAKSPSEVLAELLRAIRGRQGLSAQDVAETVRRMGGTLDRAAISKIEGGRRGVSLDEALLLAAALQVAPVHLLLPREDDAPVRVVPAASVSTAHARRWFRGIEPLPAASDRIYRTEVPDSEWQPARQSTPEEIRAFNERMGAETRYVPPAAEDDG